MFSSRYLLPFRRLLTKVMQMYSRFFNCASIFCTQLKKSSSESAHCIKEIRYILLVCSEQIIIRLGDFEPAWRLRKRFSALWQQQRQDARITTRLDQVLIDCFWQLETTCKL